MSDNITSNTVGFSDEVMRSTGVFIQKSSAEWESQVFQRAKSGVF